MSAPEFLTSLDVKLINGPAESGRGLWEIEAPFLYASLLVTQIVTVPVGFKTDFASVPRVPVAFLLAGDTASEAACLHDYLYSTASYSRSICDSMLREAAGCTGVPVWRRWLIWAGVRCFGASFYKSGKGLSNEVQK